MTGKAIVLLLIGARSQDGWRRTFAPSVAGYARRHGYRLVVLDRPLDPAPREPARPPHWQKLLVLEQAELRGFDRVVWLDHDIMVGPDAPCIVEATAADRIGGVTFRGAGIDPAGLARCLGADAGNWLGDGGSFRAIYRAAGLPDDVDDYMNTGVLVLSPERDAAVLREVYDRATHGPRTMAEQTPLARRLLAGDLVDPLDGRFNRLWPLELCERYPFLTWDRYRDDRDVTAACVAAALTSNWFLHFIAGPRRRDAATFVEGMARGVIQTG